MEETGRLKQKIVSLYNAVLSIATGNCHQWVTGCATRFLSNAKLLTPHIFGHSKFHFTYSVMPIPRCLITPGKGYAVSRMGYSLSAWGDVLSLWGYLVGPYWIWSKNMRDPPPRSTRSRQKLYRMAVECKSEFPCSAHPISQNNCPSITSC